MRLDRREFCVLAMSAVAMSCGRRDGAEQAYLTWGTSGSRDGQFRDTRAIGVFRDEVYVIDKSGRVQVFSEDGAFRRKWSMAKTANGTPTAISFDSEGRVLVADTHNSQIVEFSSDGATLDQWGEYGTGPEQFIYPTDIAQSTAGEYFISEYGMGAERVHVFDARRKFSRQWGEHGDKPEQLNRAIALELDAAGRVYVCDMSNHRVQVFEPDGRLIRTIGAAGSEPGQLKLPFDMALAPDGSIVVCEYGNNRLSRFSSEGDCLGTFGNFGRDPGEFKAPRGVAISPSGAVFVADTENHRVQRIPLEEIT